MLPEHHGKSINFSTLVIRVSFYLSISDRPLVLSFIYWPHSSYSSYSIFNVCVWVWMCSFLFPLLPLLFKIIKFVSISSCSSVLTISTLLIERKKKALVLKNLNMCICSEDVLVLHLHQFTNQLNVIIEFSRLFGFGCLFSFFCHTPICSMLPKVIFS